MEEHNTWISNWCPKCQSVIYRVDLHVCSKLPKQAQEGLEKLGEKIGEDEWKEIFTEAWGAYMDTGEALEDYLVRLYCPPKNKEK